jgi:hypothetical protein
MRSDLVNMELQQLVQRFLWCGVKALPLQGDGKFTFSPVAGSARVKIGGSPPSTVPECFTWCSTIATRTSMLQLSSCRVVATVGCDQGVNM